MEWLLKMLLLCLCLCKKARGLNLTATPDRVVLGDSGTLTLACYVTERDVNQIYDLKIMRAEKTTSSFDDLLASFVKGTARVHGKLTDDKGFSVTGVLNGSSSRLEVSMDKSKMTCSDATLYECGLEYAWTPFSRKVKLTTKQIALRVFVLPQMIPPIQAKRNGKFMEGEVQSNRTVFEVGDMLELKCRAIIGSIYNATIKWRKRSEINSSQFIDYQPPEGSYDEGTPLSDNQCGYTRTATIRYNVTTPIADYDLTFECYVSVSGYPSSTLTPSGVYTTTNNLQYHVEVCEMIQISYKHNQNVSVQETTQSTTERQTTQTFSTVDVVPSCSCSTNIASLVGVAIGSVVITLIVIGIILGVTKCLRMQNGKKKEQEAGILMNHAAVDAHHIYINEEQLPANNLDEIAQAEYEVLQESAREPNTYSSLNTEH